LLVGDLNILLGKIGKKVEKEYVTKEELQLELP
jgi:hypothetical protein